MVNYHYIPEVFNSYQSIILQLSDKFNNDCILYLNR